MAKQKNNVMRSTISILLCASLVGVAGCDAVSTSPTPETETEQLREAGTVNVLLPEQVQVQLKSGSSANGELVALTPEGIGIESNGTRQDFPVAEVERVQGVGDVYIQNVRGGRSNIRGEDSREPLDLWTVPLDKIESLEESGELTIRLKEVYGENDFLDVMDILRSNNLLVEEIVPVSETEVRIQVGKQPR